MQFLNIISESLARHNSEQAMSMLMAERSKYLDNPLFWQLLAESQQQEQQYSNAFDSWKKALSIEPSNPRFLFSEAKLSLQCGLPSSHLFAELLEKDKSNEELLIGYAHALALEQKNDCALKALSLHFSQNKPSKNILKLYADILLLQSGDAALIDFYKLKIREKIEIDFCYEQLINHALLKQNFEHAFVLIDAACKAVGRKKQDPFLIKKAITLSEQKLDREAFKAFSALEHCKSVEKDMAIMRMSLRLNQLDSASAICMHYAQNGFASTFIPYLSLIWRLQKSGYQDWLEKSNQFIRSYEVGLQEQQIDELVDLMTHLHSVSNPYLEQSVRKGTQTDLLLFARQEKAIQDLVALTKPKIMDYIRDLPPHDATHPLLGRKRDSALNGNIKFSGSWSVKLVKKGHNVSHTHPKGWISAVLYLKVPNKNQLGPAPNGFLQFGTPPRNLQLELEHYHQEAPEPGKLVLFPSTTWHQTQPFNDGERIVIAFDVKPPGIQS